MSKNASHADYADSSVEGLQAAAGNLTASDKFGESSDVFNHEIWRPLFAVLWSFKVSKKCLIGLFTHFFLHGRSIKAQEKNKVVTFNIQLPPVAERTEKTIKLCGEGVNFPLKINFPNETSKVSRNALTMERFKCVTRMYSVPEMLKVQHFPATAESIGLGNLIRAMMENENVPAETEEKDLNENCKEWKKFLGSAAAGYKHWIKSPAAVAGCLSTKEIYLIDEMQFPGCVAWAGVTALMTDAANRIRAPSMTADVKTQFERSAFFPDFKRKMIAKDIRIPQAKEFINFLSYMTPMMSKYLKTATGMTAEESSIMDTLVSNAQGVSIIPVVELKEEDHGAFTSTRASDLADEVLKHAKAVSGLPETTEEDT